MDELPNPNLRTPTKADSFFTAITIDRGQLLLAVATLLWFLCGTRATMQSDSWWHLRTGQVIWTSGSFVTTDSYSWVLGKKYPWPNHEWLSQIVFFGLFSIAGLPAINLFVGFVFAAIAWTVSRCMTVNNSAKALALVFALPWVAMSSAVRPQIFTELFVPLSVLVVLRRRYNLLPPLFFVWAQFHGGVCFGAPILFAALAATALTNRADFGRLLIASIISGAVVAINPLGFEIYTHPFKSTAAAKMLPIIEWAPPWFDTWLGAGFWIALFCLVAGVAKKWRILRRPDTAIVFLVLMTITPLACLHIRNVYLWVPLALIAFCKFNAHIECRTLKRHVGNTFVLFTATVLIAAIVLVSFSSPQNSFAWYPVDEQGVHVLNKINGPLFNSYDTGGYLIWFSPEQKVFIDSRLDPYPIELLRQAIEVELTGNYRDFFDGFGFQTAVVERDLPLTNKLLNDNWKVEYSGPAFMVLRAPSK